MGRKEASDEQIPEEVLLANDEYAKTFGARRKLVAGRLGGERDRECDFRCPPARQFSIVTCMDARIDPAKLAGLREGDAHVIRNAGGRASNDAIRSLVISYKLLGTREWFVSHHSNCGMQLFNDEIIRGLLASSLESASHDGNGCKDSMRGNGLGTRRLHRLADDPKSSQERSD